MIQPADSLVPGPFCQGLRAYPEPEPFEEAAAAHPQDLAAALAFALSRAIEAAEGRGDDRPVAMVSTPLVDHERGRLFGWGARGLGLDPSRLLLIRARREPEALWAFEEALKSGAAAAVIGALDRPAFVATRRLDFAARAGRACGFVLRGADGRPLGRAPALAHRRRALGPPPLRSPRPRRRAPQLRAGAQPRRQERAFSSGAG